MTLTVTPLRKAAKFIRGITFKPEDVCSPSEPGAVVCMRTKNVQSDIDLSDLIAIPEAFVRRAEQNLVEGDLLVSSANSWNLVGKACWVPNLSYRSTAGGFISILRCDRDLVFPRYFYHWVTSGQTQHDLRSCGRQTTNISNLDFDRALNLEIPLPHKNGKPDLDEQKRIAAILDKADAIRRKLQQSLRLSDDFLRSVFLDMFGDPVTNPKGWDKTTVGEAVEFLTSGSRGWAQYYADQGDFFIRIQNLRGGFLDISDSAFVNAPESAEARRTRVQSGDVLLSITADLGRTAVVPDNFGTGYINQHLAILRLREMNPVFVSQQLASPGGQRQFASLNRSAVKSGLNFDDIRSVELLRPPSDLQIKFSGIVTKLKKRASSLQAMLDEAEALFSSLQQRAFRGEL